MVASSNTTHTKTNLCQRNRWAEFYWTLNSLMKKGWSPTLRSIAPLVKAIMHVYTSCSNATTFCPQILQNTGDFNGMRTELAGSRWKEVVSSDDKVNSQWVKPSNVLTRAMKQYIPKKATSSHIQRVKFIIRLDQKAVKKSKRRIEHGHKLWSPG